VLQLQGSARREQERVRQRGGRAGGRGWARGCGGRGAGGQGSLRSQGGLSAAPSRAVSAVKNINLPEIPRNINIGDINIKVPNLSQFM